MGFIVVLSEVDAGSVAMFELEKIGLKFLTFKTGAKENISLNGILSQRD